ncbi:iron donor protein CyaY [Sansalvadorimonas sp. 2012CJ34-2]|uniref:Iron-sulfur cluster assembly protein CyaY n=1 Tax=Parendozoicomonas callyspongiae TaxID=2942213 RepID=A0ABT0PLB3_9GAMM|nr:iron donor protein CyaY [Sansalvadorimonas sp. 2012CJ34-2]MCL6272160.1 iron donor protein CyaY [Sansalvadorimonas sp. 2012CJ34-2]
MNESEFNDLLDDLMMAIEDAIDESGEDIDFETAAGILTLTFENRTQIILSRQGALRQLWMAARAGGFHFDFNEEKNAWICDSNGEEFYAMLNRCSSEQAGEAIDLSAS